MWETLRATAWGFFLGLLMEELKVCVFLEE